MGLRDIFRRSSPSTSGLPGIWNLVRAEGELDVGHAVDMEFLPDGQLIYAVESADRWEISLLRYRIEGVEIISDQPSAPREERTRFSLTSDGLLLLEAGDSKSWYRRGERRYPIPAG